MMKYCDFLLLKQKNFTWLHPYADSAGVEPQFLFAMLFLVFISPCRNVQVVRASLLPLSRVLEPQLLGSSAENRGDFSFSQESRR